MKKERVAIIGCGAICLAHGYPLDYMESVDLVAVCDVKEEKAKYISEMLNCKYYTDYKELFAKEDLDVVHICTPHYLHPIITEYACNLGINVLTEKPMAITVEDATKMIEAAEKNNVKLGVIFQNRYNAASQLIKKTLKSRELGKIKSAKASVTWCREDKYYLESDWKGTWDKEGGGVIIDQAIHTLDLMRWFIDDDIEYVDATMKNRMHDIIKVEDCAEGVIKYKNGVISSFYAYNYYSCDAPIQLELQCENGVAQIIGTTGYVRFNDERLYMAKVDESEKEKFGAFNKDCWGISHIKEIKNFYNYIRGIEEQDINVCDALKTQKMINAIYESARTGKKVYL